MTSRKIPAEEVEDQPDFDEISESIWKCAQFRDGEANQAREMLCNKNECTNQQKKMLQ